jgi:hypothetical protein
MTLNHFYRPADRGFKKTRRLSLPEMSSRKLICISEYLIRSQRPLERENHSLFLFLLFNSALLLDNVFENTFTPKRNKKFDRPEISSERRSWADKEGIRIRVSVGIVSVEYAK